LKDLIRALGYKSVLNIYRMNIPKEFITKIENINLSPTMGIPCKFQPNTQFINETGLNFILIKSNNKIANDFINKYMYEIMPEIRKTGQFILDKQSKKELSKINNELNKIKYENKELINNLRNLVYPKGPSLYIIIKIHNNKKYFKIGYTNNLNKRLKVYNTSFAYKIYYNYYVLVNDPKY
jgi:prophage antirepressor-like protein